MNDRDDDRYGGLVYDEILDEDGNLDPPAPILEEIIEASEQRSPSPEQRVAK